MINSANPELPQSVAVPYVYADTSLLKSKVFASGSAISVHYTISIFM